MERSWLAQDLRSYCQRSCTDGKKMRHGKALATVLLAMALLSLAQGQGKTSCQLRRRRTFLAAQKETNASVTCVRQTLEIRCSGLCDSKSNVALRSGQLHWKQECECCQPRGYKTGVYHYPMVCNDGSRQIASTPFVSPVSCHCTDCWQLFIRTYCQRIS